jgi:hypothetical protein
MARRCSQRRRTYARDQVVLEFTQQAGDRVVALAFRRLRHPGKRDQLTWWPLGALNSHVWALAFIEGRGYRERGL